MRKNLVLNTAIRITDKNGNVSEYTSIEEASEATEISVAALKIRCNKSGKMKDGTLYEWIDEHTRRSYQAKKSKSKGSALEYEVVKKLKEIGFDNVCTAKGESKKIDNAKVDIIDKDDKLPVYIQCKHLQKLPSYFTIRDACPLTDKPFTVIWKKSAEEGSTSPGTVAIIPVDLFYKFLELFYNDKHVHNSSL